MHVFILIWFSGFGDAHGHFFEAHFKTVKPVCNKRRNRGPQLDGTDDLAVLRHIISGTIPPIMQSRSRTHTKTSGALESKRP